MANRLSKIYTRTGDAGETGMADGSRISKDDLLIHAIGEVDELNSQLALVASHAPEVFVASVRSIQNDLFNVGAELTMGEAVIEQESIDTLEQSLDELNLALSPLREFILPGGGPVASHCHVARAVCRRVERTMVSLNKQQALNSILLSYINRLSDYLFVLARAISKHEGSEEIFWQSKRMTNDE
ncbi:MAG: cob(I)yrinic acid a,c-diamide adenosyltransferase [Proteobacteria bacterium]|nr:cob(I)yrinic acid a,c-diamide adenosyltransferase [Pseudomonadota bacterium]